MAILNDLPAGDAPTCRLCTSVATGTLAGPAVVDPWTREQLTAAVVANTRRVLRSGDPLCESCGNACSYDVGRADSEIGGAR